MNSPKSLNFVLCLMLVLIISFAIYYQLDNFIALKNADGILTDMRSLVLLDIRLPRIGLAILTGAGLALAGNAMQGIFQNPLVARLFGVGEA